AVPPGSSQPSAAPPSPTTASPSSTANPPAFHHGQVTFGTAGGAVQMQVEVADTEAQREYGLMNRHALAAGAGMIFVFRPPASASAVGFWMKDTLIPLSVAFVTPDMLVESIQDMAPLSLAVHYAPRSYSDAVEANQGWYDRAGVAVGDRMTFRPQAA
ncbi:MAG: DUF192 domain-containing protein, partial [Chloroflexota bacterium]